MNKIKFAVIILLIGGMIMSYTRVNWQNAPSTATPVNAENLNIMDKGIADAHSQLAEKANESSLTESAVLGEELIDDTGWSLGTGWSGNITSGFTHANGNSMPLTKAMGATGTKMYQIEFTINDTVPDFEGRNRITVSIGNAIPQDLYVGDLLVNTYKIGIKSVSDGDLVFTPASDFVGSLTNISVKEIIDTATPNSAFKDATEAKTFEARFTKADLLNLFLGQYAGQYNTSGNMNVAVGGNALANNTSGFWNMALGAYALHSNTTGARNVAIGLNALRDNISGLRNIAIGSFALRYNKTGNKNVSIGADSMFENDDGENNIAIGYGAAYKNSSGDSNISIGFKAGYFNLVGSRNVAIGEYALTNNLSKQIIAIGYRAGYGNTTGLQNTLIGNQAGENNKTGNQSTIIGFNAGYGVAGQSCSGNTLLGYEAGYGVGNGSDGNIIIGYSSGKAIKPGSYNIIIGRYCNVPTAGDSNKLNIGNAIKGDLQTKVIEMEKIKLTNLPTSDPHVAGEVWNNNGTLSISLG